VVEGPTAPSAALSRACHLPVPGRNFLLALAVAGCRAQPGEPHFPAANRDVAPIVGTTFSTEDARDRAGEAEAVMALAGVKPGMSVADVGAGQGYYTVRLARIVGRSGRVLAEDIVPGARDSLSERVQRENLDNVAVKLGSPDNPMLPAQSFDRVFLVHMYHEVQSPYAFLWHLREGVKPDGLVVLVDSNRPVKQHGIGPAQAQCEFGALGMTPVKSQPLPGGDVYFMAFRVSAPRPEPSRIKPCARS
jgi:protein-L-isoaspartate O-methyltransferase